jgi:uncharacterized lipoprotein YmbA
MSAMAIRLLAGALVLALTACAAAPVRYYTLAHATPDGPAAAGGQRTALPGRAGGPPLQIEVGPVGVADRLARPQLVVRGSADPASTQVSVLEQQRWSSPFDSELRDAFGVAIAARLGAIDVTRGGGLPEQPVYRIALQLRRFDATLDRQVDALFAWTITRSDDERNAVCQAFASQTIGTGIDELVQGIQRVVTVIADRVAGHVSQLAQGRTVSCDAPAASRSPTPPPAFNAAKTRRS